MFFLALFLSAFAYLIVPVCYRVKTGGTNLKNAKKIALINSLIVGVIFLIITVILFEDVTWSILPAVTYYYISKAILVSKEEKKKEKVKELEKKYGITLTEEGKILPNEQKFKDTETVENPDDKLKKEKKTEEIMGRIKIEEDRKIFWRLMENALEQNGNPFEVSIAYLPNGAPKHYAKIKGGNGALLGVDFLASEGVLRIQLYIDNNIALYERLQGKKEYLEGVLGFALVFQDGEKNKEVKWIKKEWSFTPHNSDEYENLIQSALPNMIKFVELFGMFI